MDFYERMEYVCQQIPHGRVATYGQIALLCGKPRNARQVGYALSHRLMSNVPAHRIVNSSGFLSGAGSFGHGRGQSELLLLEGITVDSEQRVDLKLFGWKHTLDDALYYRSYFEKHEI